jgi:hypothetical protein
VFCWISTLVPDHPCWRDWRGQSCSPFVNVVRRRGWISGGGYTIFAWCQCPHQFTKVGAAFACRETTLTWRIRR